MIASQVESTTSTSIELQSGNVTTTATIAASTMLTTAAPVSTTTRSPTGTPDDAGAAGLRIAILPALAGVLLVLI